MNKKLCFSQKFYLFLAYGLLVLVLLSGFFLFFYTYYSQNIIKDAKNKSDTLCTTVNKSIFTELNNMSTISMNIVYSNAIKNNFSSFSQNNTDKINLENYIVSRDNILAIYDTITAILGPFQSASQVNLYSTTGLCIGSGLYQGVSKVDFNNIPWYKETIDNHGSKLISTVNIKYTGNKNDISLTRLFFDDSNDPQGIVQVIQNYNVVFSLISDLKSKNPFTSIYVYDDKNSLIYPNNLKSDDCSDYIKMINDNNLQPSNSTFIKNSKNESTLLTYQKLDSYNWTVVVTEPKSAVFKSIYSFEKEFILIIFVSIIFTLLLCFIISSRFTYPLIKLTKAVSKITINRVLSNKDIMTKPIETNIKEISELNQSFIEMYCKLQNTSKEILLLKSEETKAKLKATQSLINPHFLYNSLTAISIMAEENMTDDIAKMCHSLCDYFRYITSNEETAVTIKEEISYTQKYIDCMKLRYGDDFIYDLDIPENTHNILIPKLIVQPFVENVFKHGFSSTPPWYLKISSSIKENNWIISIEDNGGCLTDKKRNDLMSSLFLLNNKDYNSLKIGGMGIKNVYLRLKLLYNEKAIFSINNSIKDKTIFIIGGPLKLNKEEFYGQYKYL